MQILKIQNFENKTHPNIDYRVTIPLDWNFQEQCRWKSEFKEKYGYYSFSAAHDGYRGIVLPPILKVKFI